MKLTSSSFQEAGVIPGEFAFAVVAPVGHVALSSNRNPDLSWQDVPAGTKSFALICHDPDVPSQGDDVNQEGREVPSTLARVDFFHWTLIDIPADLRHIAAGSHSESVIPCGKSGPDVAGWSGMAHGLNDYTGWFAGDAAMGGDYHGYDGPCPPWNDSLVHHYIFTLYALDTEILAVQGTLTGHTARAALEGHVLASATLTGTYSLNPRLLG
ncbi:MAG: phosphatidylethanolamine-binding family protein [Pseudomonas sp.]|nr:phosphatidylethanolamine-binding family protein [Pseudomonas sp.]